MENLTSTGANTSRKTAKTDSDSDNEITFNAFEIDDDDVEEEDTKSIEDNDANSAKAKDKDLRIEVSKKIEYMGPLIEYKYNNISQTNVTINIQAVPVNMYPAVIFLPVQTPTTIN